MQDSDGTLRPTTIMLMQGPPNTAGFFCGKIFGVGEKMAETDNVATGTHWQRKCLDAGVFG